MHEDSHDTSRFNTWIEISRDAYAANLALFRRLAGPDVELSAVVKANAYGHDVKTIAMLAREEGADSYCVHSLEEAVALRGGGFAEEILVMGHVPLARLGEAIDLDLRLVLYNRESFAELSRIAAAREHKARVHLKLETGTWRQGVTGDDLDALVAALRNDPWVVLEGAYTHFADIEDTTDHHYAAEQLRRFREATDRLRGEFPGLIRHTACSAAALLFPQTHFEMLRLGIAQYGIWPSKETLLSFRLAHQDDETPELRPVLTWKTRISQIKTVPAGSFVGYGGTYQTTRETRLAILPIGYSDGYDRGLSNRSWALVHGRRAPLRGRVCMNLVMIDVTDIPEASLEDEVVLLGRQGDQTISASHLAGLIGTIAYEIVARIRPGLPRVVVD